MAKKENLLGKNFGKWLVIKEAENQGGRTAWLCECQCEKRTQQVIKAYILKVGDTKSCGCKLRISHNFNDITGQTFGMLEVIRRLPNNKHKKAQYLCRCSCKDKTKLKVNASDLRRGHTVSCGCLRTKKLVEFNTKHGKAHTRLYEIWSGMKKRCYNKNFEKYNHYGGRGVKVSEEWKESFIAFEKWAIKNGYNDNLTIDRSDVNGNYEPSNCTWIPQTKQTLNTRKSIKITYKGQTKNASEWARELGKNKETVRQWYLKDIINEKFNETIKQKEEE